MEMARRSVEPVQRQRVLVFRAVLAVLVLTFAAAGLALRAAPPALAGSSPDASSLSAMSTPAPGSTGPVVSATLVCPPVMPSVEFSSATSSALTFRYQFICQKPLTVSLFRDAEGLDLVARQVTPDGVTSGTLTFTGLPSSSSFYYTFGDPNPWTGSGPKGPVKTLGPTITCQPVMPSVTFSSATSTSLTFRYQFLCGKPVTVTLYRDAEATDPVARRVTPDGTAAGTLTFTDLTPASTFWFVYGTPEPWSGSGPKGPVKTLDPTATWTCQPVLGTAWPSTTTHTTIAFGYTVPLPDGCVQPGPGRGAMTISLFADKAATSQAVASLTTPAGSRSGTLTFENLTPDTPYYYQFSLQDPAYTSPVAGPVRTRVEPPTSRCQATMTVLAKWNSGYVASVKVTSTGTADIAWKVSWSWAGEEKVDAVDNAVLGGTAVKPELTGKSWNEVLAPAASTEAILRGSGHLPAVVPTLTCAAR